MPKSAASQPLFLYSTTVSDVGTVRANNQDSSFAGEHLIAMCDGMGGHAGGDTASSIAIRSLAHIEQDDTGGNVETISRMMETSVMAAHDAIVGKAKRERKLAGMGTTVTAVALVAGYWVIAHIGDSRAYLLRDGRLSHITCDHSYVQHLINTGRITPSEAKNHPQRNVVMRVLGDFDIDPRPDISVRRAHPADRWLLCSDGLSSMIPDSDIENIATQSSTAQICVDNLVDAALAAGGHDNVTVVVVDLVDDGVMREAKRVRRRNVTIAAVLALFFVLVAGIWAYTGVTGSYYLGTYHGNVAVWRGLPGKTLGVELHWLESETSIKLSDLPEDTQNRLKAGIPQTNVDDAQDTISKYRHQIDEEQTRQVIDAQTIRDNTDQKSTSESDSEKTAEQSAEAEASEKN